MSKNVHSRRLRLAIVGCGALAQRLHLPVSTQSNDFDVVALVDSCEERARRMAERFGVPRVLTDYSQLQRPEVEAAIVALPNHLHAPAGVTLLRKGIHLLVEKPMALDRTGCEEMLQAARQGEARLCVGMVRRFYPSSHFIQDLLASEWLGPIEAVEVQEGDVFSWPVVSGYPFQKEQAGGGVLIDIGSHVLDLLLWWLGPFSAVRYQDDSRGGVEAECRLSIDFESGTRAEVTLSRLRKLENLYRFQGGRGSLEMDTEIDPVVLATLSGGRSIKGRVLSGPPAPSMPVLFKRQLENFAAVARGRQTPVAPGTAGRDVMELIEECYRNRRPLVHPWEPPAGTLPGGGLRSG